MSYPQTLKYLQSFINYEKETAYNYKKSLRLSRMKEFLSCLGNPHRGVKFIHVAGSKGKGSTCAFIAYILKEAGYRVGLYTSPHLADFRERIRVLPGRKAGEFEGMISRRSLERLVKEIRPAVNSYNRSSKYGPLTFFEAYTALALLYFKKKKVDFAVLETGLGGRLDATNAVNSLVSVIMPVSYEHMDKLGSTLKAIAAEKAGIIKRKGCLVISAPQKEEAAEVIRRRCRKFKASLYEVKRFRSFNLRLLGDYQLINASVAAKTIELIRPAKVFSGIDCIKRGLYNTVWPARCEVLSKSPLLVADAAHNAASAGALRQAVKKNFRYRRLILILGISSDKDIRGICAQLSSLAHKIILTRAASPRSADPAVLASYFSGKETYLTYSVAEARNLGFRLARRNDLVLVTGSLFVAGEFKYGKRKFN
jgi:dihydrofolate synthase/folylpolyglutamate synthase